MLLALALAVTMKLCPDGSVIAYTAHCPTSGTVRKICPSGAIVPYSSSCPATVAPLTINGNAIGLKVCTSVVNPTGATKIGAPYKVVGFAARAQPGGPPTSAKDFVILNDATHLGDGWFGIFVPIDCAAGAP